MYRAEPLFGGTVLKQALAALKLQGEPRCSQEAQRQGWAELLAHHRDGHGLCPVEMLCLARALDGHFIALNEGSDASYVRVDFDALTDVVGGRNIARLGLLLAGLWPRQVRGVTVWTDAPSGAEREPADQATFGDIYWNERELVPRGRTN